MTDHEQQEPYRSRLGEVKNKLELALLKAAPQASIIIEYLASGRGLSQLIAHTVLGITSLTTRIAELRKAGIPIKGTWYKDHSGKRFMVYKFDPKAGPVDESVEEGADDPGIPVYDYPYSTPERE